MSRYGDQAYGNTPNRWDRERFDRYRQEQQREYRPPRAEVLVDDRRGRYEDRRYVDDYQPEPRFASRVRREIYEPPPRQVDDRALQPYKRRGEFERDIIIETERRHEVIQPRPGLLRRQSSLDTFDRRPPARYEREREVQSPPRRTYREEDFETSSRRDSQAAAPPPQEFKEIEIIRETEVIDRGRAKSDAKSVISEARSHRSKKAPTVASSSSSSASPSPVREKIGKKGHTKLPKGKFTRSAVDRFAREYDVSYDEGTDSFKVHRALGAEQIDEILAWSQETAKEPRTNAYELEDHSSRRGGEHYETIRTEWINPPSVRGASPARSARTVRARSPPPAPAPPRQEIIIEQPRQEIKIIEQAAPAPVIVAPEPPQFIQVPAPPEQMTIAIRERQRSSQYDYDSEIRKLELQRELARLDRDGRGEQQFENQMVFRPNYENYQVSQYNPQSQRGRRRKSKAHSSSSSSSSSESKSRSRSKSRKRDVVRVEKDRKARRRRRAVGAMVTALT